ncbi:MAG: SH3 domain-containing protein [Caldilinea sp. CFX5]|nr:SH3 domain-containing protein [Caldilinea sp. CFX5]
MTMEPERKNTMQCSRRWQIISVCICFLVVSVVWQVAGQRSRVYADTLCGGNPLQMSLGDKTLPQSGSQTRCFTVSVPRLNQEFKITLDVQDRNGQYDLYIVPGSPTIIGDQDKYNLLPIQYLSLHGTLRVVSIQNSYTVAVVPVGGTGANSQYVLEVIEYKPTGQNDSCTGDVCLSTIPGPSHLAASRQWESAFVASCPRTTLTVSSVWSGKQNVQLALYAPNRTRVAYQDVGRQVEPYVWSSTLQYTIQLQDLQTGTRWWAVLTNTSGEGITIFDVTTPKDDPSCLTVTPTPTHLSPTVTPVHTQTAEAHCIVQTDVLNVRSGPGTAYDPPLGSVVRGMELRMLSRNFDSTWIEVMALSTGLRGWVSGNNRFISCNPAISSLPLSTPSATPALPSDMMSTALFLRPACGNSFNVQTGIPINLSYGAWANRGFDRTNSNQESVQIELRIDGQAFQGQSIQSPVADLGVGTCGSDYQDSYWLYHTITLAGLSPGTHRVQVIYRFLYPIEDGYGDSYSQPFTQQYTLIAK